jgi:hypothetical protein
MPSWFDLLEIPITPVRDILLTNLIVKRLPTDCAAASQHSWPPRACRGTRSKLICVKIASKGVTCLRIDRDGPVGSVSFWTTKREF